MIAEVEVRCCGHLLETFSINPFLPEGGWDDRRTSADRLRWFAAERRYTYVFRCPNDCVEGKSKPVRIDRLARVLTMAAALDRAAVTMLELNKQLAVDPTPSKTRRASRRRSR